MKVCDIPPFPNLVSSDQEDDDCSELTEGDETSRNEEGEFARIMALMDPSQFDAPSLSGDDDRILVNNVSLAAHKEERESLALEVDPKSDKLAGKQGLLDLRMQVAKQAKMLKLLSARLNRSQLENQTLKAEKASLIAQAREREEAESLSPHGRFALRGQGAGPAAGGSMQMLLNANSRLRADNTRLQADNKRLRTSVEGLRESLRSHIQSCRSANRPDKNVENFRGENEVLRRRITGSTRIDSAGSEDTSETSLMSGSASDENHDQGVRNADVDSRLPLSKRDGKKTRFSFSDSKREDGFDLSGGEEHPEVDAIEDNRGGTSDKETSTVGGKVTTCNKSEGLLVDFVERRRSTRRWSIHF